MKNLLLILISFIFCSTAALAESGFKQTTRLQEGWQRVVIALTQNNLREAAYGLNDLENIKIQEGFEGLEEYSMVLISFAEQRAKAKDYDSASFMLRRGIELTPISPKVLLAGARVTTLLGGKGYELAMKAAKLSIKNPVFILKYFVIILYPFLWAITLGLYICFIISFGYHCCFILREVAAILPKKIRGFVTPIITLVILIIPCTLGPLWCLVLWTAFLLTFVPYHRWLGFAAGFIVALWALLIPIRETVGVWIERDETQTLLNLVSGQRSPNDMRDISILANLRPFDGAVHFIRGQLLRREGNLLEARAEFIQAQSVLGDIPELAVERGLVEFLDGNLVEADRLLNQAIVGGLNTPQLWFNHSKIKFELMDTTGSNDSFGKALSIDNQIATNLREREEKLGLKNPLSVADTKLPTSALYSSALTPEPSAMIKQDAIEVVLTYGTDLRFFILMGCMLIFGSLNVTPKERRKLRSPFFKGYVLPSSVEFISRILPGGAWVIAGQPIVGLFIISSVLFLIFPILHWPGDIVFLFHPHMVVSSAYILSILFMSIIAIVVGFRLKKGV